MAGNGISPTVRVTSSLVTVLYGPVIWTLYLVFESAAVTLGTVNVCEVAPRIGVVPFFNHWNAGAAPSGLLICTVKTASWPCRTFCEKGCWLMPTCGCREVVIRRSSIH